IRRTACEQAQDHIVEGLAIAQPGQRVALGIVEQAAVILEKTRMLDSQVTHAQAEAQTVAFLSEWIRAGASPMCGNSICQDRRFLHRQMSRLERYFHYRNLDVSTIKELARRWAPTVANGFAKSSAHTALSDVRDSIDELRHYRQFMGALGGANQGGAQG
ncbi:oligoribonuclease, partial [Xanthomonas hortorum]|uniref:oligoribonuclease n=1 Tax=Xanthomonas hortorum TaxID=56454 RepID=UPI001F455B8E